MTVPENDINGPVPFYPAQVVADAVCVIRSTPMSQTIYHSAGQVWKTLDALGNATEYVYDSRGRLTKTISPDPDGAQGPLASPETESWYDPAGQLEQVHVLGPNGPRIISYDYDDLGRESKLTLPDPDGDSEHGDPAPFTQTLYDKAGNVLATIDALGQTTTYTYDCRDRQKTVTLPDPGTGDHGPATTTYVYDADGSIKEIRTPGANGHQVLTTYEYDGRGRTIRVIGPDPQTGLANGPVTETVYDNAGNVWKEIDPRGNVTEYGYNHAGWLTTRIQADPDGQGTELTSPQTHWEYDILGQVLQVMDSLSGLTNYAYDSLGRQRTVIQPQPGPGQPRAITHTAYDAAGNVVRQIDAMGNLTQYQYDHLGRLSKIIQPDPDGPEAPLTSPVMEYAYDVAGAITSVTDPLERVTRYEYDELGRQTKVVEPDPDGQAGPELAPWTAFTFDAAGNVLSQTDRLGHATWHAYDHLGRLSETTDAEGGQTVYCYYVTGTTKSLTDPAGNTTTWTYDDLNRAATETNQLGAGCQFFYDAAGNLTRQVDRMGRVRQFEYDGLNRNTGEIWYNTVADANAGTGVQNTLSFSYNAAGTMLTAGDNFASYLYLADWLGRVERITANISGLSSMVVLYQTFDAAGDRTQLAATVTGTPDFVNDYGYDALGRMVRVTQQGATDGNAVAEKRVDFAYDAAGQWQSMTRYTSVADPAQDLVAASDYVFDATGRLRHLTHQQGVDNKLAEYDWTFDAGNNMTQMKSWADRAEGADWGVVDYTHDDTNQLTDAVYSDFLNAPADEHYGYDANGNRDTDGYAVAAEGNNRMAVDAAGFHYAYDAEGNRTGRYHIDASGANIDITEYAWDCRNRLAGVTERATLGCPATQIVTYTYDAYNRLVGRWLDSDGDGPVAARNSYYVYDGGQIVLEFAGSQAADISHRYLWGPTVDQVLADEQVTSTASAGDAVWPVSDHLGTVRDLAIYDTQTDTTTIATHRVHGSFGNLTSEVNSDPNAVVDHLFGFTGRMFDEDTGLQNNLNRWYDASVGQWASEDPIGLQAGDTNLNRYVHENPLGRVDPFGMADEGNVTLSQTPWRPTITPARMDAVYQDELIAAIANLSYGDARNELKPSEAREFLAKISDLRSMEYCGHKCLDVRSRHVNTTHPKGFMNPVFTFARHASRDQCNVSIYMGHTAGNNPTALALFREAMKDVRPSPQGPFFAIYGCNSGSYHEQISPGVVLPGAVDRFSSNTVLETVKVFTDEQNWLALKEHLFGLCMECSSRGKVVTVTFWFGPKDKSWPSRPDILKELKKLGKDRSYIQFDNWPMLNRNPGERE